MSDLTDLIAKNGIMAFNEGREHGAKEERLRLTTEILERIKGYLDATPDLMPEADYNRCRGLEEAIEIIGAVQK